MARLTDTTATSAGGLVIRTDGRSPEIVIGRRRRDRDGVTWTLPKGTPEQGETLEETALREVGEETGLEVRILEPFDSIAYRFVQGRRRIRKTVHYFVMEATGGDLARHDREFEEVRWIDVEEASAILTFETERALVSRVAQHVAAGAVTGGELEAKEVQP